MTEEEFDWLLDNAVVAVIAALPALSHTDGHRQLAASHAINEALRPALRSLIHPEDFT